MTNDESLKLWIARNYLREGYIPNPNQITDDVLKGCTHLDCKFNYDGECIPDNRNMKDPAAKKELEEVCFYSKTKKIFCKDCPDWITPEAYGNKELGCCMNSGNNSKADDFCEVEEDQDK